MTEDPLIPLGGESPAGEKELTLAEVCLVCDSSSERIIELTEEGLVSPAGHDAVSWRFRMLEVQRIHRALRIQRDLRVNAAGAALASDLLDEIENLRTRLCSPRD